jgi:hypothetical protein
MTALAGAVGSAQRVDELVRQLRAPTTEERLAAKDRILAFYEEELKPVRDGQAVRDQTMYDALVSGLMAIVGEEREHHEFHDRKEIAIQLLGELRAVAAVDLLLDNIELTLPGYIFEADPLTMYPCTAALIQIGQPSVNGILLRLDRPQSDRRRYLYAVVVQDAAGRQGGRLQLEAELLRVRAREDNLDAMLKLFE